MAEPGPVKVQLGIELPEPVSKEPFCRLETVCAKRGWAARAKVEMTRERETILRQRHGSRSTSIGLSLALASPLSP
jgi:hypothetical protein